MSDRKADVIVKFDFFFLGLAIWVVGASYVQHLEHESCRARGGLVKEAWLSDECVERKP